MQHKINQHVAFKCHILGKVRGKILNFKHDVSNGQLCAEIELFAPYMKNMLVTEPVVNLDVIS